MKWTISFCGRYDINPFNSYSLGPRFKYRPGDYLPLLILFTIFPSTSWLMMAQCDVFKWNTRSSFVTLFHFISHNDCTIVQRYITHIAVKASLNNIVLNMSSPLYCAYKSITVEYSTLTLEITILTATIWSTMRK